MCSRLMTDEMESILPELILLGIQLPLMDGYAVARELRKNPALSSILIVAVTSYAMQGDREKSLAVGCNDYIEKPINPETFITQLQQFLPWREAPTSQ